LFQDEWPYGLEIEWWEKKEENSKSYHCRKFMMQFFSSSLTGNGALIIKLASSKVDWKILKKNCEKAFDLGVITHGLTSLGGDGMFIVRILIIDDGV